MVRKIHELYQDYMIFKCNLESTRLKHILKQATTANQEFWLILVQRRDAKTLLPIIRETLLVSLILIEKNGGLTVSSTKRIPRLNLKPILIILIFFKRENNVIVIIKINK